jgi:hypothetical protein
LAEEKIPARICWRKLDLIDTSKKQVDRSRVSIATERFFPNQFGVLSHLEQGGSEFSHPFVVIADDAKN